MKLLASMVCLLALIGCSSKPSTPEEMDLLVKKGMSEKEVIGLFGKPDDRFQRGGRDIISYDFDDGIFFAVLFVDDIVIGFGTVNLEKAKTDFEMSESSRN